MRLLRSTSRVTTALAACSLALLNPAAAYAGGVSQVSGVMAFDGAGACAPNPASPGAYLVAGGLVGCWYQTSIQLDHQQNSSYRYSGTELFDGCLGDRCGTFTTTFTFTAQYADDGTELHGRCHHPITGGTDGFAGAGGVINMHDNPDGSVDYAGHLSFDGSGNQATSTAGGKGASRADTTC